MNVFACTGYAASDLVQANPLVATLWGILFFRVSPHPTSLSLVPGGSLQRERPHGFDVKDSGPYFKNLARHNCVVRQSLQH
jgi:hypothetical protein